MERLRLRDIYEARTAMYLFAALTDPAKRRSITPKKFLLIASKPEKKRTASDLYYALREYQAMRDAAKPKRG